MIASKKAPKPAKKPKHVSKTKQELRRLREFARKFAHPDANGLFVGGYDITGAPYRVLRDEAVYALTGKKSEAMNQRDGVAEVVKRLNAMSSEQWGGFLAEGDDQGVDEPDPDVEALEVAEQVRAIPVPPDSPAAPPRRRPEATMSYAPRAGGYGHTGPGFADLSRVSRSVNAAGKTNTERPTLSAK